MSKKHSSLAHFESLILLAAATATFLSLTPDAPAQIITNASDNAGNYSGGWTNGANGGTGFGAWTLTASGGTGGFGGNFIGNPSSAGISGMSPTSFGQFANPIGSGAYANAERSINVPLAVGQTLSFQWGINYDSGSSSNGSGNKGFNLVASGTEVVNVNNGGSSDITINGTNVISGYGTTAMSWNFTRKDANTITVVVNKRDGSGNYSNDITVANGAVSALKFYSFNMQGGDQAQPYFNILQIAGPAPATVTNQVTFSVDMSYQVSQGLLPSNSTTVQVRGSFNGWAGNQLTNQGNNIYTGTFNPTGLEGDSILYKYFYLNSTNVDVWESISDRSLTLGANGTTNNLPVVYFNNLAGQRFVTFSVNMAAQVAKGAFNTASNSVLVAGSFNNWNTNTSTSYVLTNQGSNIYSGSFLLSSSTTNSALDYKYFTAGTNAVGYEAGFNRTFNLVFNTDGSNSPALVLATNYFSNEQPTINVSGSFAPFSTTVGSNSVAQSASLSSTNLFADVVVSAVSPFLVSTNGTDFASSVTIPQTSGVVASTLVYAQLQGLTAGTYSNNITFASTGATTLTNAVSGTVTSASAYSSWLSNYPSLANTNGNADPDGDGFVNNLEFAFDGNPTLATPALLTVTTVGTNAVFKWVQRNQGASYEVQNNSTLTNAWTGPAAVTVSNSTDQSGINIPADYTRKEFVVPASGKDFYRVKSSITNN